MVTSGGQAGYREFCGYSPKICSHPALRTGKKKKPTYLVKGSLQTE